MDGRNGSCSEMKDGEEKTEELVALHVRWWMRFMVAYKTQEPKKLLLHHCNRICLVHRQFSAIDIGGMEHLGLRKIQ